LHTRTTTFESGVPLWSVTFPINMATLWAHTVAAAMRMIIEKKYFFMISPFFTEGRYP
jgi:hypothetical protein